MTNTFSNPLTRSERHPPGDEPGFPLGLRRVAISLGALLVTVLLGRMALHRFDTPVRELSISGALRHVQPDAVRLAAAPALDPSLNQGLFSLDLATVREAIERLPWVARARVDRQWPGRLRVRIVEREVFARWGESEALSTEGVVFAPGAEALVATLPQLAGAAGREREVMAMYGQLADRLSETPFALKGLAQDARGEWTGTTTGGITLRLGRANPIDQLPRLKGVVMTALAAKLARVARIDLRYANGFAVALREAAAEPGETFHETPAVAPTESASPPVVPGASP